MSYLAVLPFKCPILNKSNRGAEVLVDFSSNDIPDGVICSEIINEQAKICSKSRKPCIVLKGFVRRRG